MSEQQAVTGNHRDDGVGAANPPMHVCDRSKDLLVIEPRAVGDHLEFMREVQRMAFKVRSKLKFSFFR